MRVDVSLVAMKLWQAAHWDPGRSGIDYGSGQIKQARVAILKDGNVEQTVASDPRGKEEGVLVYLDPYEPDFYPMLKSYKTIDQVLTSSALFSMIARKLTAAGVEYMGSAASPQVGTSASTKTTGIGVYNQATGGYD